MSKYFEVLERLEGGRIDKPFSRDVEAKGSSSAERARADAPVAPRIGEPTVAPRVAEPTAAPRVAKTRAPALAVAAAPKREALDAAQDILARQPAPLPATRVAAHKDVEEIFQNIQALTKGKRPLTLVLAGAASTDAVRALAASLGTCAESKGERVLLAELSGAGVRGTLIRPCGADGRAADTADGGGVPIELHSGADPETVARWRDQVSPGASVTFVMGPPLVDSVNSALLASLCDGLVMVAVREDTHRDALTVAAERVRLTKAPTIGVVVDSGHSKTPLWLRRLLER